VLPRAVRQLGQLQKRHQFDLIHAHLPMAGFLARIAGRWYGLPVVYTEHNLQERYHPLTRWFNRMTYGWNRQALAVSEEVTASIGRFGLNRKSQVITLPNGVAVEQVRAEARDLNGLRAELGIPHEHLVVGTVAVFRRQKRLLDWLEAAARIAAQRADVTFLLVGHGPEEASLKARVQALGLAGRVRLPGFRPDGRRLLALMDVYLMSSEFEGLPIALLEAMALGKPVVATAVGGIPEVVQPGQEGFLTPVGAIDELAAFTIQLLAEPERRRQMGQQGAGKVAENFHWQDRVRAMERLYLEVLG
jgi:glycosyltransferase involved in cell wall biosynthesis